MEKVAVRTPFGTPERVWATRVPEGFRIENICVLAEGVSLHDVVDADLDDRGFLVFRAVVRKSGNRTIQIRFDTIPAGVEDERLKALFALGCRGELSYGKLLAMNVPRHVEPGVVEQRLAGLDWRWSDRGEVT